MLSILPNMYNDLFGCYLQVNKQVKLSEISFTVCRPFTILL